MISRDVENGDKFHYVPSLPHGQETRTAWRPLWAVALGVESACVVRKVNKLTPPKKHQSSPSASRREPVLRRSLLCLSYYVVLFIYVCLLGLCYVVRVRILHRSTVSHTISPPASLAARRLCVCRADQETRCQAAVRRTQQVAPIPRATVALGRLIGETHHKCHRSHQR